MRDMWLYGSQIACQRAFRITEVHVFAVKMKRLEKFANSTRTAMVRQRASRPHSDQIYSHRP